MPRTATADAAGLKRLATPAELRHWSDQGRAAGLTVGLVPTMGALHAGHRSLIQRCRAETDRTVVSIFVNPPQFNSSDDLAQYPRALGPDLALLSEEGVHGVFAPGDATMYPPGHATTIHVGGGLTEAFEGPARPGHFNGVALVVAKLLMAARPDRLYLGEKDAQQCAVIGRLVLDLDIGVQVRICPTVRDADGLALSSRNRRLSPADRARARSLPAALAAGAAVFAGGDTDTATIARAATQRLDAAGLEPEYMAVVDADTFEAIADATAGCRLISAVTVGRTRLIDAVTLGDRLERIPCSG